MNIMQGNRFKDNTFKNENTSKKTNTKGNAPRTPTGRQEEEMPTISFRNGKGVKILGLGLIFTAIFFSLAFISYLFTWQDDQSYVSAANGGWGNLFKSVEELEAKNVTVHLSNWAGKMGALLSHQFIYTWFGLASFVFIFLFFIIGCRLLLKIRWFDIRKSIAYSLFLLLFVSVSLGFLHSFLSDVPHFIEGRFGFYANELLAFQMGKAGVGFLLFFIGLIFAVIAYNIDFKKIKIPTFDSKTSNEEETESDDIHENEIRNGNIQRVSPMPHFEQSPQPVTTIHDKYANAGQTASPIAEPKSTSPIATNLTPNTVIQPDFEVEFSEEDDDEVILQPMVHHPTPSVANVTEFEINEVPKPAIPQEKSPSFEVEKPKIQEVPISVNPIFDDEDDEILDKSKDLVEQFGTYDPTLDLKDYQYPTLDLLKDYGQSKIRIDNQELQANKESIVRTLSQFDIKIDKIKATVGPTVTLYEIIPAPGIRISKIKNLENDIALSLAALGIRIIAPIPGQGTIGIEVPNKNPEMVSMRTALASDKFQNTEMDLPIALGKTISNEVFVADLAKMPHLLVAGATGQGKSVGINAILTSLLYKKHPSQLKFILVDPKKVELSLFKTIERHFLAKLPGEEEPIITDNKKVIHTLNSLCIEMDQRYDLLKDASVRNLKEYNQKFINRRLSPDKGHRYLPYIVLVIDEFADLIMTAGKEVEAPVARLAQLARAIGIHLVVATQRPSVNVITGMIKANFPARLAFRVLSGVDSKTILDTGGADQLIGRGDMLLSLGNELIRLQCAFLDTPEAEKVAEFIGSQRGYTDAYLLPEYIDENGEGSSAKDFDPNDRDSLFEDAARLIVSHQSGSTSLIQRKMKLGYNRAGRIMDQLEAAGIVGPFQGSKVRDVLIPDEYSLEQFLDTLGN